MAGPLLAEILDAAPGWGPCGLPIHPALAVAFPAFSRRSCLPTHPPKSSSLLSLCRTYFSDHPLVRRCSRILVRRALRHWRGLAGIARQHSAAFALHIFLPFAPAHRGRQARLLFMRYIGWPAPHSVALDFISERAPHAVCVAKSMFSWTG